ncbi:SPASM domain-containing protein [Streptomyces sp. I05A-00742]|uniref:SPASM domain-containing protein n=1 Tax=Streptomyces sp. I05A-00742 TaxID=2732853 RepID=UPI001487BD47|nr:SPASM domain-containing protein [Streptomyces sp. I05A-00742]
MRGFAADGGRAVTFHGGRESTLHPGYPAVCDAGHEAGLRIGLVTDGSRLGRPDTAECVASTHTWVRVGLPAGTATTFRAAGRAPDRSLTSFLDDVGRLRQSAIDPDFRIGFHYVITERNRAEILPAARAARDAGAHYIRFAPGRCGGPVPAADLREAARLADDAFEVHLPRPGRAPDGNGAGRARFGHCHYSRFTAAVGADGQLYPCPQVRPDSRYRIGDVLADGYAGVLDGSARAAWEAADPLDTALCGTCSYRPQNELLELLLSGHVGLDDALGEYAAEVPSTLHAEFL